jgi:hypothetical protein
MSKRVIGPSALLLVLAALAGAGGAAAQTGSRPPSPAPGKGGSRPPSPGGQLPDSAFVVRGGQNRPSDFNNGSGATEGEGGKLQEVAVNSAPGKSVRELTAAKNGYRGIRQNKIGVTTVGAIRAAGGDVVPTPDGKNRYHATLSGLTAEQASELFTKGLQNNPNAKAKGKPRPKSKKGEPKPPASSKAT